MRIIGDTRYPLSKVITVSGLPEWMTPDLLLPYLDEAYDSGFEGLAAYQLELSPADSTFANEGRGKRVILGFDSQVLPARPAPSGTRSTFVWMNAVPAQHKRTGMASSSAALPARHSSLIRSVFL